ncbi:MAG TPA: 2-oxo acid dehydrogenase subunit E2 [Methylomirabilota bacterium]|nr:2-oxo acid dehydrogenase subunit E2 [Methylomirabilota bacterium]
MDVRLPKLGEGADSGSVVGILVAEGDQVKKGQTIIELENEKAVAPIPSPADGKVAKLRVKIGDKVSVGQPIITLEGASGSAAEAAPAATVDKPKGKPAARRPAAPVDMAESSDDGEDFDDYDGEELEDTASKAGLPPAASPSIRRIAAQLGINLRKLRGSAEGGRIVMDDLRGYIQRLQRLASQARRSAPPQAAAAPAKPAPESIDFSKWGPVSKKPLTPLRQTIARRMVENWNSIPHVTQFEEIDITLLNDLRKKHAAAYEAKGARLTVTTFVLKAVAATLKKHPIFNSSIDEATNELVTKEYIHIGLAVDTEAGLIVPVIRDVDKKDLVQLSKDITQVAEKARDRKVSGEDLKGGTFTISNQGGIGGAHFTPIVNKPEVAILGLGRASLKPMVVNGKIEPRLMMPIGLSYDHRVIDGGVAARFTVDLLAAFQAIGEADVKL